MEMAGKLGMSSFMFENKVDETDSDAVLDKKKQVGRKNTE